MLRRASPGVSSTLYSRRSASIAGVPQSQLQSYAAQQVPRPVADGDHGADIFLEQFAGARQRLVLGAEPLQLDPLIELRQTNRRRFADEHAAARRRADDPAFPPMVKGFRPIPRHTLVQGSRVFGALPRVLAATPERLRVVPPALAAERRPAV